jgi:hypothetical protein
MPTFTGYAARCGRAPGNQSILSHSSDLCSDQRGGPSTPTQPSSSPVQIISVEAERRRGHPILESTSSDPLRHRLAARYTPSAPSASPAADCHVYAAQPH